MGDWRQLRPIVKSRDAAALGLGRSFFERMSVLAEAPPAQPPATAARPPAPAGAAVSARGRVRQSDRSR